MQMDIDRFNPLWKPTVGLHCRQVRFDQRKKGVIKYDHKQCVGRERTRYSGVSGGVG